MHIRLPKPNGHLYARFPPPPLFREGVAPGIKMPVRTHHAQRQNHHGSRHCSSHSRQTRTSAGRNSKPVMSNSSVKPRPKGSTSRSHAELTEWPPKSNVAPADSQGSALKSTLSHGAIVTSHGVATHHGQKKETATTKRYVEIAKTHHKHKPSCNNMQRRTNS